jgi:hypothetical protein
MLGVASGGDDRAFRLTWNGCVPRNTFHRCRDDRVFGETWIRKQPECCEPAVTLNDDVTSAVFYDKQAIDWAEAVVLNVVRQNDQLMPLASYEGKDCFALRFDGLMPRVVGIEKQLAHGDCLGLMLNVGHAGSIYDPSD